MKKTYIISGIAAFMVIAGSVFFVFAHRETDVVQSIPFEKGDFVTKNTSKADLQFIKKDDTKITVSLVGPADELKRVVFNQIDGGASEFSLPADSKGIRGTITVPQGVKIINLDLPPEINLEVEKPTADNRNLGTLTGLTNRGGDSGGYSDNGNNTQNPATDNGQNGDNQEQNNKNENQNDNDNNDQNDDQDDNQNNNDNNQNNDNTQNNTPDDDDPATPPVTQTCGNGTREGSEQCDDGNKSSGDGCSSSCVTETVSQRCGDGFVDPNEQCDDGNRTSGDGCSSFCLRETITAICGNGTKEYPEQCDDGNTVSGDGCSPSCTSEPVYTSCTLQIKQEERNACCAQVNATSPHEDCEGYWLFDYNSRLCYWHCPPQDCSNPTTQSKRDSCCATNNENKPTPACFGEWIYDNTNSLCEYQCAEINSNGEHDPEEIDQTSQYCINTYTDENDIDKCCDEFLKHPLSLGPHPGYPDCLGTWSVKPGTNTCQFACVTHEEAIEIMKKLKKNAVDEE